MNLLRLLTWPYVRKHVLRTALTALGVALGVAVFVGMRAANQSVLLGFSQTIDRIAGKTDLQVTAGEAGFGEDVLETVQAVSAVRAAGPVIEVVVDSGLAGQGTLLVLGVDMTGDRSLRDYDVDTDAEVDDPLIFLAQPDSLILSNEFAAKNGLRTGSSLHLDTVDGPKTFTVRGLMKTTGFASAFGGNLAVMDIYAAQKMFGRGRTFDRIDLAVGEGLAVADVQRQVQSALGPGFEVQPPASRGQQAQAMLAGFTTMVQITSGFALFIGMFIIYNAFATAVAQRRSEIGVLRALGATRRQVRGLFLAESAVLGLIGSVIGIGFGILMAHAMSAAMGSLVSSLYGVAEQATAFATDRTLLSAAVLAGVITSMAAASLPARDAASVEPVVALRKGPQDAISIVEHRARFAMAGALALFSVLALTQATWRPAFYAAYAATIGVALLVAPWLIETMIRALRPGLAWLSPVEGAMASDSLVRAPRRVSATVAALMLCVALITAFAGIARATYGSIADWINSSLNADLFVMTSPRLDLRTMRFPATMGEEIAAVPGVGRVQRFRNSRVTFRHAPAMVVAIEMDSVSQTASVRPVAGDRVDMYRKAAAGQAVIVSDSLAQRHHLTLGDTIDIPAPYGALRLPIAGVVVDYTDQQGSILIDRSVFLAHWHDDSVSDFRVFAAQGTDPRTVRERIIERYAGVRQVFVMTNEESRAYVLQLAGQWFGLMNVQIAVGVLVAILGIFNALTVSIGDRRRELGVLRAIGALHTQIRRTIWIEALSVGVLGLALGAMLGAVNLWYLLEIVRRDVAGIRLAYAYPLTTLLLLIPIMLGAAFAAAVGPAEAAVRTNLVEALEYE